MAALYIFHAQGCPACVEALPEFDAFCRAHPEIGALTFDATGPYPEHFGVKVRYTPCYAARATHHEKFAVHQGKLSAKQLEAWLKREGILPRR